YFSHLSALKDGDRIVSVYVVSSKYVLGIILPMAVGICLIGSTFLGIWIGPDFAERSDILIYLLVLFTTFLMITPFSSRYLTAINKHGYFAKQMPIAAAMNIGLSIFLVHDFGIVGVALGSAIPVVIFVPITLYYTCSNLGISVSYYLCKSVLPCI